MRGWVWVMVGWFCVACSTPPTFTNAQPSTPLAVLPVAITNNQTVLLPTAVSDSLIAEADAEYILLTNLYERTAPSVVNIEAFRTTTDSSRGSGFIYDTDGHIVTNAHVIQDAQTIRVTFNDGYVVEAERIGVDSYSDLGVVRVNTDESRLLPLQLTNSDAVRVGQRAITIGNPFGLQSSMTVGIISAVGRTLASAELIDQDALLGYQNPSIIQTDTPINVGSSGAPLLNSQGDVVGVTTAIRTDSGVFQGVGFAVPANTVARVVPDLIAQGRVEYPWLGISVDPEGNGFGVAGLAEALQLPVKNGVLVRGITLNSPADVAGLRGGNQILTIRGESVCAGGDIIVAINDVYMNTMDDLTAYLLDNARVGDRLMLRVVRGLTTFDVPLTLSARPQNAGTLRDCSR